MKLVINNLRMNFGKYTDKDIELKSGFNVVFGDNEAGKSTIFRFIGSMFFSYYKSNSKSLLIEKDQKEKDRPWHSDKFSGALEFTYNKESYHLFRNFNTEDYRLINLSKNEEVILSDPRNLANLFFGMSKETFNNIITVDLKNPWIDKKDKNSIKNEFIKEFYEEDKKINLEQIKNNLLKRNQEIGTDRVSNKELGLLNKEIIKLEDRIIELNSNRILIDKYEEEKIPIENKLWIESNRIKYAKLDLDNRVISFKEYEELLFKIKSYNDLVKISRQNDYNNTSAFFSNKKILIVLLGFVISSILFYFSKKFLYYLIFAISFLVFPLFNNNHDDSGYEVEDEINILKEEIDHSFSLANVSNLDEYRDLVKPIKTYNVTLLEEAEYLSENEILDRINYLEDNLAEINFKLNSAKDKLIMQRELFEELEDLKNQKEELLEEIQVNELIVSSIIKTEEDLGRIFQEDLAKNISEIIKFLTNYKYDRIILDKDYNLSIYDEEKLDYVDVKNLSSGTIQIINIAFRIAIHQYKSKSNLPLILDDVSNYLDYDRSKKLFELLNLYSKNNQIILFTNNREELSLLKEFNSNIIYLSDAE